MQGVWQKSNLGIYKPLERSIFNKMAKETQACFVFFNGILHYINRTNNLERRIYESNPGF
ncbi:hypothetical protein DC20_10100 [Rufibacter tibetensis]|uniref:Uncharacterized protein n=1 Tax=Rufibacter tibetensis TaxID=512763 RepID=A0A0N7HWH5_9BACT|nr:hypothetical protein DC20_10100 [Rufibacter tibetensis]